VARLFGIDYLFIGPAEQQAHPDLVDRLAERPDLFLEAYRNSGVVIFRLAAVEFGAGTSP
jgi:hypothetical protein